MLTKKFDMLVETKADDTSGEFTAIVAAFGNVDRQGDRIVRGAFKKTIAEWQKSGDPIPIILSHQWDNPMAHIGVADPKDVREVAKGLLVRGKLDVKDNPVAAQIHRLMARRSLREFSIGYGVPAGGEKTAEDGANELLEIDLVEAGPTLKGANPATELVGVKSALDATAPPEVEPRSEQELRRESAQFERERTEERLPDVEVVEEVAPEPEPVVEKAAPADEQDLRRQTDRLERDRVKEQLPVPGVDPAPSPLEVLTKAVAHIGETMAEHRALLDKLTEAPPPTEQELRLASDQLERDRVGEQLPDTTAPPADPVFPEYELAAAEHLKAVWTARYINDLPDSAFLYVEPGGSKDADGKTAPRSLRHFPYKNADGSVDLPHLRNALARIPQSSLSQAVKDRLTARATSILNAQKADRHPKLKRHLADAGAARFGDADTSVLVDDLDPDEGSVVFRIASEADTEAMRLVRTVFGTNADGSVTLSGEAVDVVKSITYRPKNERVPPDERRPPDPLRKRSDQAVLEIQSDGASLRKYRPAKRDPAPSLPDEGALRKRSHDAMIDVLTGGTV